MTKEKEKSIFLQSVRYLLGGKNDFGKGGRWELLFFGKIFTPAFVQVAEKVIRNLELNPEEVREDTQKNVLICD